MSSLTDMVPALPEFAQNWSIWGGSGHLLRFLHHDGAVPYWACMSLTNVVVRTSLIPLVLQSAHTQTRVAPVAPELQFLITMFQNDMKKLKAGHSSPAERYALVRMTHQTIKKIYSLHKIHPFAVFKSPLMQLPFFYYFSIDIRKIINGADPELAQQLTEGGFLWVTNLTDPDPWYGLPVLAGALLYLNVEVAVGRRSLSGETASKSNTSRNLKDFFQSLAVFMPCLMSNTPAGVQIYLATSMIFTMCQSAALRNDTARGWVGLPAMSSRHPNEGKIVQDFVDLKMKEKEARDSRGGISSDVPGKHGVLFPGFETAFLGTERRGSILGSTGTTAPIPKFDGVIASPVDFPSLSEMLNQKVGQGVLAPRTHVMIPAGDSKDELPPLEGQGTELRPEHLEAEREVMTQKTEKDMDAANRGIIMLPKEEIIGQGKREGNPRKLNVKRVSDKKKTKKGSQKKRPRSRRR